MHEYPVTLEIIRLAEKTAEENHGRVRGIHLVIGEDSGFIGESIQMYFDVLAAGTLCCLLYTSDAAGFPFPARSAAGVETQRKQGKNFI